MRCPVCNDEVDKLVHTEEGDLCEVCFECIPEEVRKTMLIKENEEVVAMKHEVKAYKITTVDGSVERFTGRHRPDLDAKHKNWHYYETIDGEIIHFRAEYMVKVVPEKVEKHLTTVAEWEEGFAGLSETMKKMREAKG